MSPAGNREELIFRQAIQRPKGPERDAFMDQACAEDPVLRARLGALVQAHEQPAPFLEEATVVLPSDEAPGTQIGRYKILEKVGEGGFGTVYVAEQREPVKRRVALKLIKLGMDTRQVVARFEAERQALALMDHPNIAKVFDAGATDTGRPYFVMELVKGVPITRYCEQEKTELTERLKLVIQICHAIQHAHQKGIIHRDIKPSNILVTLHDGVPVPKVIDFGIAKATQQELTEKTIYTQLQQFIGTPAYMSPEQAEMSGLDIDTRSDIYSLGVLLYELLTGSTPFDTHELLRSGLDEMRKIIREREPMRPSTRLRQTTSLRTSRSAPGLGLSPLATDLDWIVMKCLEKDRRRRYETANGLAQDIERHLQHEPLAARPPTTLYRVRKFVLRNKMMVTGGALVAGVLMLGILGSTWQACRAYRAEQEQKSLRIAAEESQRSAEEARERAVKAQFASQKNAYAADMSLAYQAVELGQRGQVRKLLASYIGLTGKGPGKANNAFDPRGWEWRDLWQRSCDQAAVVLRGHSNVVTFAGMLADEQTVVSTSHDRTVRFWDLKGGRLAQAMLFPCRLASGALSPDRRWLAIGGEDGSWWLCDTAAREIKFSRTGSSPVRGLAFSGDNMLLAVSAMEFIEVWDLKEFGIIRSVARQNFDFRLGVAFSPDTQLLGYSKIYGNLGNYHLMLCGLPSGTPRQVGDLEGGGALGLVFGPDGRNLVCAERLGLSLFDVSTGALVERLTNHLEQVISVVLSPDGRLLASAGADHAVRLADTRSWQERGVLRGHEMEVFSVAFSPNGARLLSCGKDETVRVWDVKTAETSHAPYRWPSGCSFLPRRPGEGGLLKIQVRAGLVSIGRFDVQGLQETESEITPFPITNQIPDDASADLEKLAFLRRDGSVEIWSTKPYAKLKVLPPSIPSRTEIALGRTGRWLAASQETGGVEITDLDRDQTLAQLESLPLPGFAGFYYFRRLSFWAQDTRFVRVSHDTNTFNQFVEVWILPGLECKRIWLNHKDALNSFWLSTDGNMLATSAFDGQVKVWDVMTGRPIHTVSGSLVNYISVTLSPDGTRLAAGAWDGFITMWDTVTWRQVARWKAHPHYAIHLNFLQDGNCLLTQGCADRQWGNWEYRVWNPPSLLQIDASEAAQVNSR